MMIRVQADQNIIDINWLIFDLAFVVWTASAGDLQFMVKSLDIAVLSACAD